MTEDQERAPEPPVDPARRAAVDERLRRLVTEWTRIPADKLEPGAELMKLGASSVDVMELVIEVETAFDLEVPDTDLGRFRTYGAAVDYVARRARRLP